MGELQIVKRSRIVRVIQHFLEMCWHFHAIFLALLALIILGAGVIAMYENIPLGEAIYFSFITGMTIGYGDIVPHTTVGRVVSVALGFVGILFTGLVVAVMVRAVQETWKELGKPD